MSQWPLRINPLIKLEIRVSIVSFIDIMGIPQRHAKPYRVIESLIKKGFLGAYVGQDKRLTTDHNKENLRGQRQ